MRRPELELYAESLTDRIAEAEEIIWQSQGWLARQQSNVIELQQGAGLRQEIVEQERWIARYREHLSEVHRQLALLPDSDKG